MKKVLNIMAADKKKAQKFDRECSLGQKKMSEESK